MADELYSEKSTRYFALARTEIAPLLPDCTDRVFEIGCGAGATISWLRSIRPVRYAAGIELVPQAARQAEQSLDAVIIGNIEVSELPFAAGSFDMILALDVLEHLVDPWAVVRRLHRLLAPNGVIIASIPNVSHYSVAMPLLIRGRWSYVDEGLLDRTHLRFFTQRTAVELMSCSGLMVDKIDRTRLLPKWVTNWPDRIGGRNVRWYFAKMMKRIPACHFVDFQFLIRAKSSGS